MQTTKDYAITTLEIAESNFLMSLKGIQPKDISKQVHLEINHIAWIVGHCVSHMDSYLGLFTKKRQLTEEQRKYLSYSAPKEPIKKGFPFSFKQLIDQYLEISDSFFTELKNLPEDHFNQKPPIEGARETYLQMIQRISLHYLGHTGQIVLIRRMLGNPTTESWKDKEKSWSFVSGITSKERQERKEKWLEWWKANKEDFD